MKNVLILGSTGSIGRNALDLFPGLSATHRVVGLSGHDNADLLIEQTRLHRPVAVGTTNPRTEEILRRAMDGKKVRIVGGKEALTDLIEILDPHIVLMAVSGAVGLSPSLFALDHGMRLALANKESLVMAGHLLRPHLKGRKGEILPVDSEHSAVFQALRGEDPSFVRKVILTASGGPFLDLPAEAFAQVTPEKALRHPTWSMGRKISIDSATMMNKALEIVEARWLFNLPPENIEVVVHRQSILHGMAEFRDGSIVAQMGVPDMRVPIRFALTYPDRAESHRRYFDLERWKTLTFEEPDRKKFPALDLGYRAAREGGLSGTVLNAANEAAVELFLKGCIRFDEITTSVCRAMDSMDNRADPSLDEIRKADQWAREVIYKCT